MIKMKNKNKNKMIHNDLNFAGYQNPPITPQYFFNAIIQSPLFYKINQKLHQDVILLYQFSCDAQKRIYEFKLRKEPLITLHDMLLRYLKHIVFGIEIRRKNVEILNFIRCEYRRHRDNLEVMINETLGEAEDRRSYQLQLFRTERERRKLHKDYFPKREIADTDPYIHRNGLGIIIGVAITSDTAKRLASIPNEQDRQAEYRRLVTKVLPYELQETIDRVVNNMPKNEK